MDKIWYYMKKVSEWKAFNSICLAVISLLIVKLILIFLDKFLKRSKLDQLVCKLVRNVVKALLLFIVVIMVLSSLGISVSTFIAVLSVVGVAFSLAIQGFLSNAFGGIQIISNKPFKIGDYIEVGADSGLVREVGLFYTKLDTFDRKLIQIPNGKISNDTIVNYTNATHRRVEFIVCVSYDNDVDRVLSVLVDTMLKHPLVLREGEYMPYAHVKEYQYSHICYTARAWCLTDDFWTVYFEVMDDIRPSLVANGVTFSYPHMNIHMIDK